ncbi:MFS general substrate transporter [Sodiomyces alkalinus F11]|uniref:MFS general substrate transporter n=1 Tax=Sodiomyces alkalinus (strain CBS 110278 / VKM F-3762 / F11) TaxID=1314773 RepID=A0A3N2PVS9_SODAK|nr:MFS general substrate transporter [Sodiomyces alkalinus F11]ROT38588.1 MFS general substrate transporter [Sodiomyces alkalinus F11]
MRGERGAVMGTTTHITRDMGEETPLLITTTPASTTQRPSTDVPSTYRYSYVAESSAVTPAHAGTRRTAAISAQLTHTERIWLYLAIFLVGYSYGLDSQVRSTYQPYATSSLSLHSYHSTINVLRSVVAVASQPTAATLSDAFGRFHAVAFFTVLYTVGTAIEACANSVEAFCLGAVLYQIGYTAIILLLEVLVADVSSMRSRVLFSYVPAVPFIINTWISGNVTSAVLRVTTWRWGIGMWCIIYPVASLPLLAILYSIERRAGKHVAAEENSCLPPPPARSRWSWDLLRRIDAVGLVTLVAAFSFTLAPLTVAGGKASHWQSPSVLVPLVVGLGCFPLFVLWEKRKGAETPLIPFHLMKDRGVWSALAVRSLLNFAWTIQGNYLYTVLVVGFDFSIESATRITSFFSFFGVVSGILVGFVIYRVRRLKSIIVAGTCVFMAALGILINFPGGASVGAQSGLVAGQVLLGLAGGLFAYPTQASIQASATREHVAMITGLYLSFFNVGSAFGNCVSGAIWTQTLYPALASNLAFQPNGTLAQAVYDSPFTVVPEYPVGGEIRDAIIDSYSYVQRLLCITACCLCVPMIGFSLALRNPRLSEDEVQEEAEEAVSQRSTGGSCSASEALAREYVKSFYQFMRKDEKKGCIGNGMQGPNSWLQKPWTVKPAQYLTLSPTGALFRFGLCVGPRCAPRRPQNPARLLSAASSTAETCTPRTGMADGDGRADMIWTDKFTGDGTVLHNLGRRDDVDGSRFEWSHAGPDQHNLLGTWTNEAETWFNRCEKEGKEDDEEASTIQIFRAEKAVETSMAGQQKLNSSHINHCSSLSQESLEGR